LYKRGSSGVEAYQEIQGKGRYTIIRESIEKNKQMVLLEGDVQIVTHASSLAELSEIENATPILTSYPPKLNRQKKEKIMIYSFLTYAASVIILTLLYFTMLKMITGVGILATWVILIVWSILWTRDVAFYYVSNLETNEIYYTVHDSYIVKYFDKTASSNKMENVKIAINLDRIPTDRKIRGEIDLFKNQEIAFEIASSNKQIKGLLQQDPVVEKGEERFQLEKMVVFENEVPFFTLMHEREVVEGSFGTLFQADEYNSIAHKRYSRQLSLDVHAQGDLSYIFSMVILAINHLWTHKPLVEAGGP
jgi:hypothetical protein